MKKFWCIILSLLICVGTCGCLMEIQDPKQPTNELPSVTSSKPIDDQQTLDPSKPNEDPTVEPNEDPTVEPTIPENEESGTEPTIPDDDEFNVDPPLPSDAYYPVIMEEPDFVYGQVAAKLTANIVFLKLYQSEFINTWGEFIYIITDQTDMLCVGDDIAVDFSQAERPYDEKEYLKIIADQISFLAMPMKPIIYLYPETPIECSVTLSLMGELTCTYPDHGEDGWTNFTAYPDGMLIFPDGKEYYALYWEGIQYIEWDFSQGFCVAGEDTAEFLEWVLAEQGLTRREANEFIVYWLPQMQDNPYNVISFQTNTYTDGAVLDIDPAPDSLLRVFMAYYSVNDEIEIEPQSFDGFMRKGFTVVEWGGSQVKMP